MEDHAFTAEYPRMLWRVCSSIAFVFAGAIALGVGRAEPMLVHNASPSVPVGFYLRSDRAPGRGAFVTVRAADVAPLYAQERDFADRTDRFIKRVAAAGGETVCAHDGAVTIGVRTTLARALHDSAGRRLPRWSGCRTLAHDELFLLGDTSDSFDSRYWGPVSTSVVDGVWTPLFGIDLPADSRPR